MRPMPPTSQPAGCLPAKCTCQAPKMLRAAPVQHPSSSASEPHTPKPTAGQDQGCPLGDENELRPTNESVGVAGACSAQFGWEKEGNAHPPTAFCIAFPTTHGYLLHLSPVPWENTELHCKATPARVLQRIPGRNPSGHMLGRRELKLQFTQQRGTGDEKELQLEQVLQSQPLLSHQEIRKGKKNVTQSHKDSSTAEFLHGCPWGLPASCSSPSHTTGNCSSPSLEPKWAQPKRMSGERWWFCRSAPEPPLESLDPLPIYLPFALGRAISHAKITFRSLQQSQHLPTATSHQQHRKKGPRSQNQWPLFPIPTRTAPLIVPRSNPISPVIFLNTAVTR